jgi:hypothetical protein
MAYAFLPYRSLQLTALGPASVFCDPIGDFHTVTKGEARGYSCL